MKRFVVCLDGTWNNASREVMRDEGRWVYRPTNVLKLARATSSEDDDRNLQITYYDAGVGAMNRAPDLGARVVKWVDNTVGGGWGGGFEVNIEEAYTFLSNNYSAGDEIFIFGFSRGASQARSLCRLIEWFGGFPTKNDVYYVPSIVTRYLSAKGDPAAATLWDEENVRREGRGDPPLDPVQPANIVFLGVWDTVLALGSRFTGGGRTTNKDKQFHTPAEPPSTVSHVRHAIAIDETRHDFQPEIFREDTGHASLEQRWFAGVHSSVGGGLENDGLANCALRWIVDEARIAGLAVRPEYLKYFRKFPGAPIPGKSLGFKAADIALWPIRGFNGVRDLTKPAGVGMDASVFSRLNADVTYRPPNLMQFLARRTEFDEQLGPEVKAEVTGLRERRR